MLTTLYLSKVNEARIMGGIKVRTKKQEPKKMDEQEFLKCQLIIEEIKKGK